MSKKIIISVIITGIIAVIVGLIVAGNNIDLVGILKRLHGG
ncbi:hypothetical protein [Paenibacillus sp. Soil787]|nr:hypothetical protein [Paenibacillus sp. Soil787]